MPAELYECMPYIHINMWAVGAQVHFSWLPCLHFFPLFESSPCHLCTHCIHNRFRIIMLDSYRWRRPAHPFRVVALVLYRPFWIVAILPVSCHRTCCRLTHFGSSLSRPFWIIGISPVLECRHLTRLDHRHLTRFVSSRIANFGLSPFSGK